MTWYTVDTVRPDWGNAPDNDDVLEQLLEAARLSVIAYAPALADPAEVPEHYVLAQKMQAENIYNANAVTVQGEFGEDTYARAAHPLDWMIKQILRPRRAVPRVR